MLIITNLHRLHLLLSCSFFNFLVSLCLFIFGCPGSLLLLEGFLQLQRMRDALCCSAWDSHCGGFSLPEHGLQSTQALAAAHSRVCTQQLWCMNLVALMHVGSSWTRDQTHTPALSGEFSTMRQPGKSVYLPESEYDF